MNKPFIRVENVEFEYKVIDDDREYMDKALRGVSLDIYEGEYVVVLGHNGSGKSTLARLLNGQNHPTTGEVWVKEMNTKDPKYTWEIRKTCGIVFQNPTISWSPPSSKNVAFGPGKFRDSESGFTGSEWKRRWGSGYDEIP